MTIPGNVEQILELERVFIYLYPLLEMCCCIAAGESTDEFPAMLQKYKDSFKLSSK